MKIARYAIKGSGYCMWSPGNKGLPEFWFGSLEEAQEFAKDCGWKLRKI